MSEWRNRANCAGTDQPDVFFPTSTTRRVIEDHLRWCSYYCTGCPVTTQCLEYALTNRFEGIWAGTSDEQRAAMRRRRQPSRSPR